MARRDVTREARYAVAGAMSLTTSELLQRLHRAAGGPVADVASLSDSDRSIAVAAVRARSAAAACSALVARLLIIDRDCARHELPEVGRPSSAEPGVTTVELKLYVWQASSRAVEAARAEVAAAVEIWQGQDGDDARGIAENLLRLLGYLDELVELFHS